MFVVGVLQLFNHHQLLLRQLLGHLLVFGDQLVFVVYLVLLLYVLLPLLLLQQPGVAHPRGFRLKEELYAASVHFLDELAMVQYSFAAELFLLLLHFGDYLLLLVFD